jgi:hypothetical protein
MTADGFNAVFAANAEMARNDTRASRAAWQQVIWHLQNQPHFGPQNTH